MSSITTLSRRLLVVLAAALVLSAPTRAERTTGDTGEPSAATAQLATKSYAGKAQTANCTPGSARVFIDINNAIGPLYNIGALFWRSSGDFLYEIPNGSGLHSIFATGLWVGGLYNGVDTDLRFAGSTYGPFEFWPGPLGTDGDITQSECATFDQFWKVNKQDIIGFTEGTPEGTIVNNRALNYQSLRTWPIAQGAPYYVDDNGNNQRDPETEPVIELDVDDAGYSTTLGAGRQINLDAGERPDIVGDQGIWWVMNDVGNTHGWSAKPPLGIEIRVLAFAFRTADALNNTTFYRYELFYRNTQPMQETYIGYFSDPDLGDYTDDYVGSDPDLGLGFVYNGDANDAVSLAGYGALPPALGYDYFQGPLVGDGPGSRYNDGEDNDGDGQTDEENERLQVDTFFYFTNSDGPTSDPAPSDDRGRVSYQYMQGIWKDQVPMTIGGDGYNPGSPNRTRFAFPGDPPSFWSEYNVDGLGTSTTPADRRFGIASGPFTLNPGDKQEIVFGIVWSQAPDACRATATPQIASLQQLKFDDITVQGAFNADFVLPQPPSALEVTATPLDQEIILQFDPLNGSFEDLINYEVDSPFADPGAPDDTYNFEGIRIIQFRDEQDQTGTVIATLDLNNSVTTVVDSRLDCSTGAVVTGVVASGSNSGTSTTIPTSFRVQNDAFMSGAPLRNNTTYYFGVQPYAYNEFSSPRRVFNAPLTRVQVRPSIVAARNNGTVLRASTGDQADVTPSASTVGGGLIQARIVNPAQVNGDVFQVQFFTQEDDDGNAVGLNYRIVNTTTGEVILDGEDFYARTGRLLEQTTNVASAGGLAFDVIDRAPALSSVVEIVDGEVVDSDLALSVNSALNQPRYFVSANGATTPSAVLTRTDWQGNVAARVPIDYEIRFVENPEENGQVVLNRQAATAEAVFMLGWQEGPSPTNLETFGQVNDVYGRLPFQTWEILPGGGERQVMAAVLDDANDRIYNPSAGQIPFAAGESDAVYDRVYLRSTPYNEAAMLADPLQANADFFAGIPTVGRFLYVPFGGHSQMPAPGTRIRYVTTKPNFAGDVYTISTANQFAQVDNDIAAREALDLITITPNPYRGASGYETGGTENIARFVNLPANATIRIYTLSGTLIRTLNKANDGNTTLDWNLRTQAGLPAASGIYLIHIEARTADNEVIGERILKFGLVQRRIQLDFV